MALGGNTRASPTRRDRGRQFGGFLGAGNRCCRARLGAVACSEDRELLRGGYYVATRVRVLPVPKILTGFSGEGRESSGESDASFAAGVRLV